MIEAREYNGKWKIPDVDVSFNGTLTFSAKLGAELKLFGSFKQSFFDNNCKKIIIGETNAGRITLLDSYHRKTSSGKGIVTEIYEPSIIFEGISVLEESQLYFSSVVFRAHNLFQWFDSSDINITNERNNSKCYSINYQSRENIEFSFRENTNGFISFDAPLTTNGVNNRIELYEQAYVSFHYPRSTIYNEILTDISRFISFLTLVTFEQSYPTSIVLLDENETSKKLEGKSFATIKCIYKHTRYSEKHKVRKSWHHLFSYTDISSIFAQTMENWFDLHEEMESVIMLLTNFFKNKYLFSEERFMECIRAIESFHRISHENNKLPKQKYKELVSQVKMNSTLEGEDLKWLEAKLMGNEPSLGKRLEELINAYQNPFIEKNFTEKVCRDAKNSRNYYTHFDKSSAKKALQGAELSDLTRKLRGLLISAIFTKLNIDYSIFVEKLHDRLD
ncbi:HEPN domain-containing protein [Flagellimonas sp.]|uniref:ApeA N-terminal domain 1-containing protein n=1 Tax=Flagellimonas sp. TaxID=2058762 RepID=UPI003B502614